MGHYQARESKKTTKGWREREYGTNNERTSRLDVKIIVVCLFVCLFIRLFLLSISHTHTHTVYFFFPNYILNSF